MAAQATASRASSPAISRPRRVRRPSQRWKEPGRGSGPEPVLALLVNRPSTRGLEHVPDAADGMDQRLAGRGDLLAQVADVQLDHVGLAAEVIIPDPVQDLGLG